MRTPRDQNDNQRGTLWRRLLQVTGLAVVAAATGSASCGKTNNYEYIDVNVFADANTVSKMDFATQIVSCEMYVTGAETSSPVSLNCMPTQQSYPSVGTFEWTTTQGKGALQFTVTLFGLNRVPFAVGTSEPVTLGSGQRVTANVVAVLAPGAMTGTGGTTGSGGVSGSGGITGGGGAGGTTVPTGGTPGNGGASGAGGVPGSGGTGGSAGGSAGRGGAAGSGGVAGSAGQGGSTSSNGGTAGAGTAGAGGDTGGAGGI